MKCIYFFFLNTIFLAGFADGVIIFGAAFAGDIEDDFVVPKPQIHRVQFPHAERLYLPGPDVKKATAMTNSINGTCICIHDRPSVFIATSMMMIAMIEAKRVNKPTINNTPITISDIVTIQNQAVAEKNVNPTACAAPPINGAICSAPGTFIIPAYKNNHPIRKRIINKPSDLLQ